MLFSAGLTGLNQAITMPVQALDSNDEKSDVTIFKMQDAYILGPGDVLNLKLFDSEDLSGEYTILSDGTVNFPIIGPINITNYTIQEASILVQKEFSKELLRPQLYLTLSNPRPIKVSMLGEVERPGLYTVTGGELGNNQFPSIVDAIQQAGGITQDSNLKEVILMRRVASQELKYKQTKLNLLELILEGNQSQNLLLFDGDIIKLQKAQPIPEEIINIAEANLSPRLISVYIMGQVNSPGMQQVPANTPLIQAIYLAGGPVEWKANRGNIELLRINRNGSATRRRFKLNRRTIEGGVSNKNNPPLSNGDIVRVHTNPIAKITSGIGAVTEPVSGVVNAVALFKLLQ